MPAHPHVFAAGPMARAAERRRDPRWLRERWADPATRVIPVWEGTVRVTAGDAPRAILLSPRDLAADDPILLGEQDGVAYFAVDVPNPVAESLAGEGQWAELRSVAGLLPAVDASLLAHARAMTHWHRRARFCGDCGAATSSEEAGHVRRCSDAACGASHFPRTDPAIIVLVSRGDRALLGRQAAWTPGQFSTLAGFVEPGESLEDAVAREVLEETGVQVHDVRYHSSQPWPFPASLMIGFTATALTERIRVDGEELDDARWFSRDQLRGGVAAGDIRLPSAYSISHALIRHWLNGEG